MLEDFRLRIFVTVYEKRSFTKAAKELGITQPAVSQSIADLEKTLGVQLFARLHSDVSPTPHGEQFREYAERILYWYNCAEDHFINKREVVKPVTLKISENLEADIESLDGDIRISLKKL